MLGVLFESLSENVSLCQEKKIIEAWRTLLVDTAKNLPSFGSYELIITQIVSIFGKKLKVMNSFPLNSFFLWL